MSDEIVTPQWRALRRACQAVLDCTEADGLKATDHLSDKLARWVATTVDTDHMRRVGISPTMRP